MSGFRYQAFLCYSHRDSAWADWLHHALESFPIPPRLVGLETGAGVIPRKLAPVFRDRDELPSATNLSAKVSDALAQSAALVVICSPHAAQSHWVDEEVRTFQRLGRGERIFCLIVDGEPGASRWAGREHDECIPAALTHRFDEAGNETEERLDPIAADARPGMDGRANARIKIVAGLLGVDLDDLKHRERRRRRWNVTAAIAGGLVLLCLATALAVNAVIARHAAERRQKQAEDLVAFMLGDLDDKLRALNRLDILESVAQKVVKYYATLPSIDMTESALLQSSQAHLKLGAVQRDEGRTDQAAESFSAALNEGRNLQRRDPLNVEYQKLVAESLSWLGVIEWSQGHLGEALERFSAARDALLAISARGFEDANLIDRIGSVRTNVARIFEARGQIEEARAEYQKVLESYAYLSRREPETMEWRSELGYAHNNLAQVAMKEGRLEDALHEYVADRDIKAQLFDLDQTNNGRREDLVSSNAFLGRAYDLCGETVAAATYLRLAMEGIEALLKIDANSTEWLEKAGNYGWMIGQVARKLGDMEEAERSDRLAVSRLKSLVARDSGNVVWQRKLALAQLEDARRLLTLRRIVPALEATDAAEQAIRRALVAAADDKANSLSLAQLRVVQGDIAAGQGAAAKAQHLWNEALATLGEDAATSTDPVIASARLDALLRLGQPEAVRAAESLVDTGFRDADFIAALQRAGGTPSQAGAMSLRIRELASKSGSTL